MSTVLGHATLPNDLKAFWELSESSGTRNDSKGSNNLTDNNTVTSATGKVGTAAQFTRANSEYLSIASNADLALGGTDAAFTFAIWLYMDSKPADLMEPLTKRAAATTSVEYMLRWDNSTDRFVFALDPGNGSFYNVTASTFGAPSLATWYLVICWRDASNDTMYISVNDGTANSASCPLTQNGSNSFTLGRAGDASAFYWDGRMDQIGFWKRALTAQERTDLYNSGNGLPYKSLTIQGVSTIQGISSIQL